MWASSAKLGCAFSTCENLANGGRFYACNYGPAGNIGDFSRPYELPLEQGLSVRPVKRVVPWSLGYVVREVDELYMVLVMMF